MRWSWILASCFASLMAGSAFGQKQSEYLVIENESAESIQVFVKTRYPTPTAAWPSPTSFEAGKSAKILLGPDGSGYEPFDIDIRYDITDNSGTDLVFSSVYLCGMMRECARNGKQDWTISAETSFTYLRLPDGKIVYEARKPAFDLGAKADAKTVRIPFRLAGKKVDDPLPPPPSPPKPPKPIGT